MRPSSLSWISGAVPPVGTAVVSYQPVVLTAAAARAWLWWSCLGSPLLRDGLGSGYASALALMEPRHAKKGPISRLSFLTTARFVQFMPWY